MTPRFHFLLAALLVPLLGVWLSLGVAAAQPAAGVDTARSHAPPAFRGPALDRNVLLAVYRADGPAVTATMRATDAAAYPLFFGAPVAAWAAALARGTDYDDAYRLTLSGGLAVGAAAGLKKVFGRPRPYHVLPGVQSRSELFRRGREGRFTKAFPSGHASTAFALAASWSLSHPQWYVAGPALAGAALIGVSRLWLGVHYPSDVLAGALLGTASAVGIHLLRGVLTPGALEDDAAGSHAAAMGPSVQLRLPLP